MTSSAEPATPAATAPLTKNQKKKQRQWRAKALRVASLAKGGSQRTLGVRTNEPLDSERCSMESDEQNRTTRSWPQTSVQSCDDSGSVVSSTHPFCAAVQLHALPAVTSGASRKGTVAVASRLADVNMQQQDVSKAEAQQAVTAPQHSDAADAIAVLQRSSHHHQHCHAPLLRHVAEASPPAALLSGVIEAGRNRDGRVGQGARTDMTAALLVMESLLAAKAPAAVPLAKLALCGKDIPLHGNYKRYYGYRWGGQEDPRLQAMERSWFAGKRCLDVGCNEGLVSLEVASRFGAAAMLGLDIDASLVQRACANLARERGEVVRRLTEARRRGNSGAAAVREALTAQRALKAVWFQQGDMSAAPMPVEPGSCDAALCLSVTKWVHLNGGDAGLRALFAALHAALAPGGLLVLEPQPWRSYKQALRKQELAGTLHAGTLAALQLRPDGFVNYLQLEAGFRLVRELHTPQDGSRGFDRPMYLLEKLAVE